MRPHPRGLEGTGALVRLALRRDRALLPAWIAVFVLSVVVSGRAAAALYPTLASRVEAGNAVNASLALVAMFGRVYDPASLGAVAMVKMVAFGGAAAAILAAMITVRHSRTEEETGRLELLAATVVGRRAPLTAALAVAAITSAAVGALSALGLVLAGLPLSGSLALGAAWAGAGSAFAAVAAIAVQVSKTARGATGLTLGALGVAYVLRAVGDTSSRLTWLTWLSPLGWVHHVQAFAGNHWGVLLLPAGFAVAAGGAAFVLAAHRDFGEGVFPDRPGAADAGWSLRSPLGLAWRLERGLLLAWASALAVLGLVVGGVAGNVGSFLNSSTSQDLIRRLGGQKGIVDAYLAAELSVIGVVIAAYGVHAALTLNKEETSQRADEVLATAVGRVRWAGSYLVIAAGGTAFLALTAGLTAGAARAAQTGDVGDLFGVLAAGVVQIPAIWVVVGIAVAAFGMGSRFAPVGWIALVLFLLLGEIGPAIQLPQPVIDLSPFAHVPRLPGPGFSAVPLLVLLGIAAMLGIAGLAGIGRRDIG